MKARSITQTIDVSFNIVLVLTIVSIVMSTIILTSINVN